MLFPSSHAASRGRASTREHGSHVNNGTYSGQKEKPRQITLFFLKIISSAITMESRGRLDGGAAANGPDAGELPFGEPGWRATLCAYCKKPGAKQKCNACLQRTYCGRTCQKKDWKLRHKPLCAKLQQVFVPPPSCWREAAAAVDGKSGGGGGGVGGGGVNSGGGAASSSASPPPPPVSPLPLQPNGGAEPVAVDPEPELKNPCPMCLEHEATADVDKHSTGMCYACGQSFCGACTWQEELHHQLNTCPCCRASFVHSTPRKGFELLWKLIHDRSPGPHTPRAQCILALCFQEGNGVKRSLADAFKFFLKAAEAGHHKAQVNLANWYLLRIRILLQPGPPV